jgi:serine/threonine protein phosphatase PrpC
MIHPPLSYPLRYASEEIPSHIVSSLQAGTSLPESLFRSFLKTDAQFIRSNSSQLKAGSTSTVMLFDHQTGLTSIANSGDTRAVLSRLRTAIDVTRDMKSSSPLEIARILSSGGYLLNGRVLGSLAVARALGDCQLKEINDQAVIADPEVTSFYFQSDDEFVVIATDGLWDVMSSQAVVDMVWTALSEQQLYPISGSPDETFISSALDKIGESLANHACQALNSADNITVMIILLRHSSSPLTSAPAPRRSSRIADSSSYSEDKPVPNSTARSSAKVLPPPREGGGGGSGSQSASGAAEKRKLETGVSEDDLMRFLMDDSNF